MKLLDTKIGTDWTTLDELIIVHPGEKIALYNADANKAIYYTENEEVPTKETFYKKLESFKEIELIIGEQSLYLRSEFNEAKLMIQKPNEEIALQAATEE